MRRAPLGTAGLEVSNLCLGTMQFGWTADERDAFAVMDAFVAAGGNFIDTADIYSNWAEGNPGGVSERIIGRWLAARGNRDAVVLATKVRGPMWEGPDGEGLSRVHIARAAEESLRRLQVETIDLYQCHWPDEATPIDETLRAFDDLITAGDVRHIGVSNYTASQLEEALREARAESLPLVSTLQPHYNLVHRKEYEGALERVCVEEGLGVIPYSPLAGGFLTGKYRPGAPLPDSARAGRVRRYLTDQRVAVLAALDGIAGARGVSVAAVALAWLLARPSVTAPIFGANDIGQLEALLPAGDLALTADDVSALDEASAGL